MDDQTRRRRLHRRLWWAALALFLVGIALSFNVMLVAWVPGLLFLSAMAGISASADGAASPTRLALAWSVPVGTTLFTLFTLFYLPTVTTEGLLIFVVGMVLIPVTLTVWVAFGIAAGVEAVRVRRRRFVAPDPAWETDPSQLPYS